MTKNKKIKTMMIFDGKKLADEILNRLKNKIASWDKKPQLAVVSIGAEADNSSFVKQKEKTASFLGCGFKHYHFDLPVSSRRVNAELNKIVRAKSNSAVVVQLPLPQSINLAALNIIPLEKDADALSDKAVGMFFNGRALVQPPAPAAIIRIMESAKIDLKGKRVSLIGMGRLVGRFVAPLLLSRGVILSIADKDTPPTFDFLRQADIIISAVGMPKIVTGDMVKTGVVAIDAGFCAVGGKISGDIDFDSVSAKAAFITPVPGGVGPVMVAVLFENVVELFEKFNYKHTKHE